MESTDKDMPKIEGMRQKVDMVQHLSDSKEWG